MVYPQTIRPVDPISLAEISGATKIRRFAAPTPPVVRPFLLTAQLRGCCPACSSTLGLPPDYGTLRGMRGLGLDPTYIGDPGTTIDPGTTYAGDPGTTISYPTSTYTGDPGTTIVNNPSAFSMQSLQVPSQGTGAISVLQTAAVGANFIPGVGQIGSMVISSFATMLAKFESWFGIGAGRREADIIVPVQNTLVYQTLSNITQQILTGTNPDVGTLQNLYHQVWVQGVGFQEFVLMRNFTDRRASGQALNTVMPYLDGSCGYAVPVGYQAYPTRSNCLSWGDGTVGGVGTNGMLGAIGRAITNAGGMIPTLPDMHQAANNGIRPTQLVTSPVTLPSLFSSLPPTVMGISTPLVLIGVAALFLYKRGL